MLLKELVGKQNNERCSPCEVDGNHNGGGSGHTLACVLSLRNRSNDQRMTALFCQEPTAACCGWFVDD